MSYSVIVIIITSFSVRMLQLFNLFPNTTGDAAVYMSLGKSIASWGLFSREMLSKFPLKDHPVYPLFLGSVYSLFGESLVATLVIQSIVGTILCILIYLIAKELFNNEVALLAGIISCFYPVFIKLCNTLLSEQLFVVFFTFSLWLVVKYLKNAKLSSLIFSAFVLGVATLTRSVALLFIFALLPYLFFLNKKKMPIKTNIFNLVIFFVIFVCSIAPWTIRNYHVSGGSIIPVTEAPDRGLYNSFAPYKGKIFGIRPDNDPVMVEARKIKSFAERRKFFFSKTIEAIKKDPKGLVRLELLKVAYLWSPFSWEILGDGQARYNFGFVFIMPFFVYGTVLLLKRKKSQKLILLLPILYFQGIHLIYFALPRFRIGFEPMLIIIAAFGIYSLYCKVIRKGLYVFGLGIFLLANFMLFLHSLETKIALRAICIKIGLW